VGRRVPADFSSDESIVTATLNRDGAFASSSVAPGSYRVFVVPAVPMWIEHTPAYAGAATLVVREGDGEVSFDTGLLPLGLLAIRPMTPTLPRRSEAKSPAQARLVADARVTVLGPDGARVVDAKGVARDEEIAAPLYLAPGRYVARLEIPGEAPFEEEVTVAEATIAVVTFAPK
jgi:hypothetical protein